MAGRMVSLVFFKMLFKGYYLVIYLCKHIITYHLSLITITYSLFVIRSISVPAHFPLNQYIPWFLLF
jgi:hypothetical protein